MATFKTFKITEKKVAEIRMEAGTQILWANRHIFLGGSNVSDAPTDRILITDKLQFTIQSPTSFFAYNISQFGTEVYLITI